MTEKAVSPPVDPEWAKRLEKIVSGSDDFRFHGVAYHSSRDPRREAARQAAMLAETGGSHFILLGAGLGFLIRELLALPQTSSIYLLEPDAEMAWYFLSHPENAAVVSSDRFTAYFPRQVATDELEELLPWLQGKQINRIVIHSFRPALTARPDLYQVLRGRVQNLIEKRGINQATIMKFQGLWNRNISLNLPALLVSGRLSDLFSLAPVKTVVIAGAGPSLSESFADLRRLRSHFFLLSADTAVIPLLKAGIIPDLAICADPQWLTWYFTLHPDARKIVWVMDPVVNHLATHQLLRMGVRMLFWDNVFVLDQMIRSKTGSRGEVAHGGSVSTNAFDIAVKLKAETIILCGQDLSFSGSQAHVKGAALEAAVFSRNDRFATMEMHNRRQLKAMAAIPVPPIRPGESLYTNGKMQVFIEWFTLKAMQLKDQLPGLRLCNATAQGVLLPGYETGSLESFLSGEQKVPAIRGGKADAGRIRQDLTGMIETLLADCESAIRLYRENYSLTRQAEKLRGPELKSVLDRMSSHDERLRGLSEANSIISLAAQNVILDITESGRETDALSSSRLFYGRMSQAAHDMRRMFRRMLSFLHQPRPESA